MKTIEAKVEKVGDAKARIGEGAIWSAERSALLWVDVSDRKVLCTYPDTGVTEKWTLPELTPFVQPCVDGTWLVGQEHGIVRLNPSTGAVGTFVDLEADNPTTRTNDATCDRDGRLLVGTMRLPEFGLEPIGSLYQITDDGTVRTIDTGLFIPNGLAFDPSGRTVYWADTYQTLRQVWRAPYERATGRVGEKQAFVRLDEDMGRPDGATIDAAGCYWVAAVWGWQLLRFTPSGALDLAVRIPVQRPTKLAFGGPDLKTIFVTSFSEGLAENAAQEQPLAGHLLAINLGIQGLPPTSFNS